VPTEFRFDGSERLIEARNRVSHPQSPDRRIDQLFRLSGEIASGGLRWPRRIDILHDGKPYFTLELSNFSASGT